VVAFETLAALRHRSHRHTTIRTFTMTTSMQPAAPETLPLAHLDFGIRVAIVGAGPAAFYAAVELLRGEGTPCQVDMFDRLPTPYGLVRTGVAPDRPKVKTVTRKYESELESHLSRFRLFCNVEVGRDLSIDDLRLRYHAVILATGARSDRLIGVAGETLPRVYSGADFAAWYNGHPEHRNDQFDLRGDRVVVIGMGNVALDVARLLLRTRRELTPTDIADHALDELSHGRVRSVVVLGRSGPAQAAFTPDELEQLTQLEEADLVVDPVDLELDARTRARLDAGELPRRVTENLRILKERALPAPRDGRRSVQLRFWAAPDEIIGDERGVRGVRIRVTEPEADATGTVRPRPTDRTDSIDCHAVFRAVGSAIVPTAGVPFDQATGNIPHDRGQVLDRPGGLPVAGLFVAGWAKHGPKGIIATNKLDAVETVQTLREAHAKGLWRNTCKSPALADVPDLLSSRGVAYITYADWKLIDAHEVNAGLASGRPRRKLIDVREMFDVIASSRRPAGQ
jgi:ferredoxin--NADP+ reductase